MNEETKEQIKKVLMALYNIPGQYIILAWISWEIAKALIELTNLAIILFILAILFFILEFASPIIAGIELYRKAIRNLKKIIG